MFLSIIVPAYNEETRLPKTLELINSYLLGKSFLAEVIIVDNASNDKTFAIASDFAHKSPNFRVIQEFTKGKGAAVRTGMLNATGEWRFMCDADLSMPIEQLDRFINLVPNFDVAVASREGKGSVRIGEPKSRHLNGRIFNIFTRLYTNIDINDTQCGFKCFSSSVTEILFTKLTTTGWAFDVEILMLAKRYGLRVIEVPITWYYMKESKIRPVTDAISMIKEVVRIRSRMR